eukprot:5628095-Prymnesium_polylepis.4
MPRILPNTTPSSRLRARAAHTAGARSERRNPPGLPSWQRAEVSLSQSGPHLGTRGRAGR